VALSLVPPKQRSSIGRYESGHDEPSLDTVEQLAKVLNVSPCWLAFGVNHAK
jgi:transcriptional regulator with XRE-family HTH domain